MTYREVLKLAFQKTEKKKKEIEAAKLLLMEMSCLTPTSFYLSLDEAVSPLLKDQYFDNLHRYLDLDEPIQHIIGHAYFYGRPFLVNPNVLIPRVETEQLVEHVLIAYDTYFPEQPISVLDLGTGSGCIGISIQLEAPLTRVTISDISEAALEVAKTNAQTLHANVKTVTSNWFSNINGTFDIIVSNPPYIPQNEPIEPQVEKEPKLALYGGTSHYEAILKAIKPYLNPRSLIAFEHGYQQKEAIKQMVHSYHPDANVVQLKDLQGKDRFTLIGFRDVLAP